MAKWFSILHNDENRSVDTLLVQLRIDMSAICCFLNVDKPLGPTSREVVDRVTELAGTRRVGHAGTLDPLASGVLVIAVGRATRLIEYVQRGPKTYQAVFRLGQTSQTDDREGTITKIPDVVAPLPDQLETALLDFAGTISQTPPQYSARKVAGRRAYELARKGKKVELQPRTVTIHSIELLEYNFPNVGVRIVCSGGTYIRSIARDLGEKLGTGGLMTELRRCEVGNFAVSSAVPLQKLTPENWRDHALPPSKKVLNLPTQVQVDEDQKRRFLQGQSLSEGDLRIDEGELVVFDRSQRFLGIATYDPRQRIIRPTKGGFV